MRADRNSPLSEAVRQANHHRSSANFELSNEFHDCAPAEALEPDPFRRLLRQIQEMGEYLSYYAAARSDRIRLCLRNQILWILMGALGFVALAGLVLTAGWLLLVGLAEGLSVLFGDRIWAGHLLSGALLLGGLSSGICCMTVISGRASRARTVAEYGKRQAQQKTRFGSNVAERAGTATSIGSERLFLKDQAVNARTAMRQTLHEIQNTTRKAADLRSGARQHPWLVIGSGMAAGFVTGAVLTRPRSGIREESVRHEREPLRRGNTSWASTVETALKGAAVTALQSALTAAVVSFFSQDETGDMPDQGDDPANRNQRDEGTA